MPNAKKSTASKSTPAPVKRPRGRPSLTKRTSTVAGLVSSTDSRPIPSAPPTAPPLRVVKQAPARTNAAPASPRAHSEKPGGNQLPQGVPALRAAIGELMRQRASRLTVRAAEDILRILITL